MTTTTREQKTPVTGNETYTGKFEYELRSTARPYHAKQMGVIEGEVRVRGDRVSIYEDPDTTDSDRPSFVLSRKAGKSLFTDHDYDMNWTTDRKLVVGTNGPEKIVVTFHRRDD